MYHIEMHSTANSERQAGVMFAFWWGFWVFLFSFSFFFFLQDALSTQSVIKERAFAVTMNKKPQVRRSVQ